MKRLSIFMGIFIIVSTTACTAPHQSSRTAFVAIKKNTAGEGGNPEVLNHCFALTQKEKKLCFYRFFPDNSNLLIHPSHGEPIMLAGRGGRVERRELQLNNDDRVLLYLNVSNVNTPLSSNVKETLFTYDQKSVVVNIKTNEIKEQIILKDRKGNIILKYRVKH